MLRSELRGFFDVKLLSADVTMTPNNALKRTVRHRRGTVVVADRSTRSLGARSPLVDACVIAGPVRSDVG